MTAAGRSVLAVLMLMVVAPVSVCAQAITHTVAVGGVTERSARFWLRSGVPSQLAVEVSAESSFAVSVLSSVESATPERNYAAIVEVGGLTPATRYYYRAVVDGQPESRVGVFATFPDPGDPATFTFAFGSCQQSGRLLPSETDPGNVFREVAAASPLFFLQLGDWGYPDTTDRLPGDSSFFSADFGRLQATYLTRFDPQYPMDSLLRIAPVAYVYDDHDYLNDNASALSAAFSLAYRPNPFSADFYLRDIGAPLGARENSIRAYVENMPCYPLVNESRGIYQQFRCGSADFFLLDLRSQRSPNLEAFGKNAATQLWEFRPDPGHSILGRDVAPGTGESQFTWLLRELRASTAAWKFLVSSVPFNQGFGSVIEAGVLLQNLPVDNPLVEPGTSLLGASIELADKWAGFPADGDSLLAFLAAEGIEGVIVLSGDSHTAAIDDGANAGLPEIMAGGLDITNSRIVDILSDFGINIWNSGGQGLTTEEFNNAFGKVTVFGEDSVRLALVDEFGTEFASHTVTRVSTGVTATGVLPAGYALSQNYPNPFNPATRFEFTVPVRSHVRMTLHSILGQELAVLVDGPFDPGRHQVTLSGATLASGTYFCRMQASSAGGVFTQTRALTLVR